MQTEIDFRYTFIQPKTLLLQLWEKDRTVIYNLNKTIKHLNKIIVYNYNQLQFQYQLLDRLDKKFQYQLVKKIEQDIQLIEKRLELYREMDNLCNKNKQLL